MSDVKYFENWHWNEKNVSEWCKDKITELLTGLQIEDDRC